MNKVRILTLALAGVLSLTVARADDNFASRVVQYDPGLGFADGYTNAATALGAPSAVNPYGEAVDPFNPPYGTAQVVSIGAGGSLTLKFEDTISNKKRNPFGVDFIIFGNAGFIITNDFDFNTFDWIGAPATDGSLFGPATGAVRVSVSRDGRRFHVLDGAPTPDGFAPTDAVGDALQPVDPALTAAALAGATLADIRAAYAGSGGGTGFDIASARDARGKRVSLSWIKYVRIEVLDGKIEVDAVSNVRPAKKD